jgi:hypothetical protein
MTILIILNKGNNTFKYIVCVLLYFVSLKAFIEQTSHDPRVEGLNIGTAGDFASARFIYILPKKQ